MKKTANILVFIAIAAFMLIAANMQAIAGIPELTEISLGAPVSSDYYLVIFDDDGTGNGVWIDPGNSSGNSTTAPTGYAAMAGFGASAATLHGTASGYGQILLSLPATASLSTEMSELLSNMPTNANPDMFGGAQGPVNVNNIDLDRAGIPAGTSVIFTVNMNGSVPHMVSVMGGTTPTVDYNEVADELTVTTTTFGTTTNDGDSFTSFVGFAIFTDETMGTTPLRIIACTDAWIGDIFPFLPGFDANAVTDAGTLGTEDARGGVTIYGPSGESRQINLFIPDAIVSTLFGASVTPDDLVAYIDSTEESGATITTGVSNFGVTGTLAEFTYTFASPRDASMGPTSPVGIWDNPEGGFPSEFALLGNYPNPFNPRTVIRFALPEASPVSIDIYNIAGQKVAQISDDYFKAGYHAISWDGTDDAGNPLATGVYFYRIKAGDFTETRKMALLK